MHLWNHVCVERNSRQRKKFPAASANTSMANKHRWGRLSILNLKRKLRVRVCSSFAPFQTARPGRQNFHANAP